MAKQLLHTQVMLLTLLMMFVHIVLPTKVPFQKIFSSPALLRPATMSVDSVSGKELAMKWKAKRVNELFQAIHDSNYPLLFNLLKRDRTLVHSICNDSGDTVPMAIARAAEYDVLKELIANYSAKWPDIIAIAAVGDTEQVQQALSIARRKPNGIHKLFSFFRLDVWSGKPTVSFNQKTALHVAAEYGRVKIVRQLVKAGDEPDKIFEFSRRSALHLASDGGHIEVIKYLTSRYVPLSNKLIVDINRQDVFGFTPLMLAVSHGYLEATVHFVSKKKASLDSKFKTFESYKTWLHLAVDGLHVSIVKFIFSKLQQPASILYELQYEDNKHRNALSIVENKCKKKLGKTERKLCHELRNMLRTIMKANPRQT